jgi:hypothetical protein
LACPFFMPTQKSEDAAWLHPSRLPLGAGWSGLCCAPGREGMAPSDESLKEHCNLGYAAACPHLPRQRDADAVRFSVARDCGSQVELWYVCELDHRPGEYGKLKYDVIREMWLWSHPNPRIHRMAECYVQAYLCRKLPPISGDLSASVNA